MESSRTIRPRAMSWPTRALFTIAIVLAGTWIAGASANPITCSDLQCAETAPSLVDDITACPSSNFKRCMNKRLKKAVAQGLIDRRCAALLRTAFRAPGPKKVACLQDGECRITKSRACTHAGVSGSTAGAFSSCIDACDAATSTTTVPTTSSTTTTNLKVPFPTTTTIPTSSPDECSIENGAGARILMTIPDEPTYDDFDAPSARVDVPAWADSRITIEANRGPVSFTVVADDGGCVVRCAAGTCEFTAADCPLVKSHGVAICQQEAPGIIPIPLKAIHDGIEATPIHFDPKKIVKIVLALLGTRVDYKGTWVTWELGSDVCGNQCTSKDAFTDLIRVRVKASVKPCRLFCKWRNVDVSVFLEPRLDGGHLSFPTVARWVHVEDGIGDVIKRNVTSAVNQLDVGSDLVAGVLQAMREHGVTNPEAVIAQMHRITFVAGDQSNVLPSFTGNDVEVVVGP